MFTVKVAAALFAVLVLVGGVGTESVRETGAEHGRTFVAACATITDPGVYELTRDVVSETYDCFRIESDGVVLDGGGHEVTPSDGLRELGERIGMPTPGHVGVGVRVGSTRHVADVTVANFRFVGLDAGVSVSDADRVRIRGIDAEDDATGILVVGSADVVVADSVVVGSVEDGVVVRGTVDVVVANTTVRDGLVAGVVLDGVEKGRLHRVVVRNNGGDGVLVVESDGGVLDGVTAEANGVGVLLMDSSHVGVANVVADRNAFAGLGFVRANENLVRDVRLRGTTGEQQVLDSPSELWLFDSSRNCVTNVSTERGTEWAVYMRDGSSDNGFVDVSDGRSTVSFVGSDVAVAFAASVDDATLAVGATPVVAEPVGRDWTFDRGAGTCG